MVEPPVSVSVMGVPELPDEGDMPAVPADGVPLHPVAPVPVTAIATDDDKPAPEIDIVPEYADEAVGLNLRYSGKSVSVVPVYVYGVAVLYQLSPLKENSKTELLGVTVNVPPEVSKAPWRATTWNGDVPPVATLPKATDEDEGVIDGAIAKIITLPCPEKL